MQSGCDDHSIGGRQPGCGDGIMQAGEECDDGNQIDWDGCTGCQITELQVNTVSLADQNDPEVAMAPDGHFLVIWTSRGENSSTADVFGQLFTADGENDGGPFQVNTFTTDRQFNADVAMAPDGSFVVVWTSWLQDGDREGIYGQHFAGKGEPIGEEFRVNSVTEEDQIYPRIAMDDSGNYVVSWHDYIYQGDSGDVYARLYQANGTPEGEPFLVHETTADRQDWAHVARQADGRFLVTWHEHPSEFDDIEVWGRLFGSTGLAEGSAFRIPADGAGRQAGGTCVMASNGRFAVSYSNRSESDAVLQLFVQRYSADGSPLGVPLQVGAEFESNHSYVRLGMAESGSLVAVWSAYGDADGDGYGSFGQRFDAAGAPQGGTFPLNVFTAEGQLWPRMAMAPDGRFVAVWTSTTGQDGDGDGVFTQRFDASALAHGREPW